MIKMTKWTKYSNGYHSNGIKGFNDYLIKGETVQRVAEVNETGESVTHSKH